MLAGVGAAVTRPYTAETVWDVLQQASPALDGHARVTFGPIELDARAYAVRVNGERIADLLLKEFEVLRTLMYHAPKCSPTVSPGSRMGGAGRGAARQHHRGPCRQAAEPTPGSRPVGSGAAGTPDPGLGTASRPRSAVPCGTGPPGRTTRSTTRSDHCRDGMDPHARAVGDVLFRESMGAGGRTHT